MTHKASVKPDQRVTYSSFQYVIVKKWAVRRCVSTPKDETPTLLVYHRCLYHHYILICVITQESWILG